MTITDEPPVSQTGKKLEKSLDAVAALRKAMEQRLAEAKAAQIASESVPDPVPTQQVQEEPALQAEPETPPPVEIELSVESAPVEEPKAQVQEEQPVIAPETPETAAVPEEKPQEQPQEQPQPQATAQEKPQAEAAAQSETPINIDPVAWTKIMIHVSEEGQKLVREYIIRNRDKPIDTMSFSSGPLMESMTRFTSRFLENPDSYAEAQLATWQNYIDLTRSTLLRLQGHPAKPIAEADAKDKRFKAKDWQTNWMFDFLKQAYLSTTDEARRLVQQEKSNVEDKIAKKLEFYSRLFIDATAPNNFLMTNPEALRATIDSKGENLIKGIQNLLQDLESGNGMLRIKMSDYRAFELGKNIATAPGKVVYQNDLMQLIQYAPTTESVHSVPLLIIPPWINKFYILDLREKNSLIRYLVGQGHTVFCISWINPDKRHALTQFDDYMETGALTALREVKRITGQDTANVMGYCIGGTLLACMQAYLEAKAEKSADLPKIVSSTYLVTMIDFSKPGDLGVFIDEEQISLLEERMSRKGYMDAGSMALTFNLLRSNDLIWPFVINNYLLGREPFPFDILYWNADATNLPATMQSYYLRKMYLENKLIEPNALKMKDVDIDLAEISTPTFMLATREDHIAPWRSTYAATHLYKGPVTFVLAGSGHIAGVVNPPDSGKYNYWTNEECPDTPDDWFKSATEHKGSWWPEWMKWLDQYAGENIAPRDIVDGIEDAPGSYVKMKAV